VSRFGSREEWLQWLEGANRPAPPRPARRRDAASGQARGVSPGEPGSHAHWNAQRLRNLIRTMPPGGLRAELHFELLRYERVVADAARGKKTQTPSRVADRRSQ